MSVANSIASTLPGLSPFEMGQSNQQGFENTPLEDAAWRNLRRQVSDGRRGDEAVDHAIAETAEAWCDRRLRQIQEYCLSRRGTPDVVGATKNAIGAVNCEEAARRLLRGEKKPRELGPRVSLDEDLRGPKK